MKSISRRLVLFFSIILIAAIVMLVVLTVNDVNRMKEESDTALKSSSVALENLMKLEIDKAIALASTYAFDDNVLAIINSDSKEAKQKIEMVFINYEDTIGANVFEIGDANGIVVFRGHNPDKFGDDKSNLPSIQKALQGEIVGGVETGSSGLAIRAFAPIMINGKVAGTIQIGFADTFFSTFNETSDSMLELYNKEALVYSSDPDDAIGTMISELPEQAEILKALNGERIHTVSKDYIADILPIYDPTDEEILGAFLIKHDTTDINASINRTLISNIGFIVFFVLLIVVMVRMINQTVSGPILEFAGILKGMTEYDFVKRNLVHQKSLSAKDETGVLSNSLVALNVMMHDLVSKITRIANSIDDKADVLNDKSLRTTDNIEQITDTFKAFTEGIQDLAAEVVVCVDSMNELSSKLEDNHKVSDGLYVDIEAIGKNINHSSGSLTKMTESFTASIESTNELNTKVSYLLDNSNKISAILEVIQGIAEQTNLLALNASIEAARAGEAGKGFAVVAEEIRKLAEQTSASTTNIFDITNAIQKGINEVKKGMDSTTNRLSDANQKRDELETAIEDMENSLKSTAENIDRLMANTKEIGSSKERTEIALESISAVIQETAATSEEIYATLSIQEDMIKEMKVQSINVKEEAENLSAETKKYKL